MIRIYQMLPVVAALGVGAGFAAPQFADNQSGCDKNCCSKACCDKATDAVSLVKLNIAMIGAGAQLLSEVKEAKDVAPAVTKLQAMTVKAKKLDECLAKMKPNDEQATAIAAMKGKSDEAIKKMVDQCRRLRIDNLMSPELRKAINDFAAAANIEEVVSVTTVEVIEED